MFPSGTPHADDMETKPLGPLRRAAAHMADPDDEDGLAANPVGEQLLPSGEALMRNVPRNLVVEHQERHDGIFLGLVAVDASAVGEDSTRRQPVEGHEMSDARAMRMDPAQLRSLFCKLRPVELVAEQHLGGPDRLFENVAVAPDREFHLPLETRVP